jgi:ABC-type multidrug transport system ATPase subunit
MTDELIDRWQLQQISHTLVRHLSGGQRRLVGLATALIGRPPVLLLDEPTNDLDPGQRQQVWTYLRQLNAEEGTTVILVTHNVVEAERVLERVAIIANGQMVGIGRVGEIKAQVDNRIRLDLTFKPNSVVNHVCGTLFQSNSIHWIGKHRVLILVERARADAAIKLLLSQVNIEQLADFRIQSANLEDVYIQLMSDWNEKE